MKVLHLDENHPALVEGLQALGFQNDLAFEDSLEEIMVKVDQYDGLIIRSKYPIDETFLARAKELKFIARAASHCAGFIDSIPLLIISPIKAVAIKQTDTKATMNRESVI